MRASFDESHQRYGSPRIHEDLIEQEERVSRKRVIRLMQEDGLEARARKRFKCTTMSDHDQPVAANLLDRCFEAPGPNQRWVGDTTEFVIGSSGKLYLAVVLDLFSRFVVGWAVSAVNDRHVTIKALDMALKRRCPDAGLLHHSDQGCTYASEDYQTILGARGIVCSMSRRGNCYDCEHDRGAARRGRLTSHITTLLTYRGVNAVMESFFSTVKSELADRFDTAVRVVEVNHCDRRKRRNHGKNDTIDAETAARAVLAGIATAVPKTADGASEMVRQIKVARDTAVKARSSAIITLKTLIVNAPGELRETLEPLTDRKLIDGCAASPATSSTRRRVKHALRALATRAHAVGRDRRPRRGARSTAAPTLREAFGIAPTQRPR